MAADRSSLSSKRGNLRGLIRLARPLNLLYAAGTLALLRFGWMARWGTDGEFTSLPWPLFLEGMGVVVLLMAAGNWINAYFDVVEDRINRPDRAIVDRTVKRRVLILATRHSTSSPWGSRDTCARIGRPDPAADGPGARSCSGCTAPAGPSRSATGSSLD